MKKIFKRFAWVLLLLGIGWAVHYAWVSFPIISGYDAKQMCTCIFVSGMDKEYLEKHELADFPLSLGSCKVDMQDSSVTCTVWGFAKKKAIYRKGIGCTLINDITEKELRSQVFNIPPAPSLNTDTVPWPMGDKLIDSFPASLSKEKLMAAVNKAFEEPYPDKKVRTRAVVVVYDRQLVAEQYAPGFSKDMKMYGWSMAKSVTAALTGTLVMQGKLDIKKPAPVPEWKDSKDPRNKIALEDLLQQQSGLNFKEDYTGASDVTNMLYKIDDMA
ncbi:MAG: serine hydrolase, partial [Panacibacter sp.]